MMAELKKEKKEGNSQPSEKLRLEYKTNRLEERTKTDQADSGNRSRTFSLAIARFLLAVKSTTKRASSPASWLSERQKIDKVCKV